MIISSCRGDTVEHDPVAALEFLRGAGDFVQCWGNRDRPLIQQSGTPEHIVAPDAQNEMADIRRQHLQLMLKVADNAAVNGLQSCPPSTGKRSRS